MEAKAKPALLKRERAPKKKMTKEKRIRYFKDNSPFLLMILPAVLLVYFLFHALKHCDSVGRVDAGELLVDIGGSFAHFGAGFEHLRLVFPF